jgi:putative tryptophan/tyrosine transport system substrate-binding protein
MAHFLSTTRDLVMDRRTFIGNVAGSLLAAPFAARAQKPGKPVIGFLNPASPATWVRRVAAFRRGLADAGYIEGKNVSIEFRWAEGRYDRLQAMAVDLVRRQVAVIVATGGGRSVLAAKAATSTIPIVFTLGNDPVRLGLIASVNRPGGNITGVSILTLELAAKRLEVLHALVPKADVIALLSNPDNPQLEPEARVTQDAARGLGLQVLVLTARNEEEIAAAFAKIAQAHAGALLVGSDALLEARRDQLMSLAARYAMPTLYSETDIVAEGGLASYGANFNEAYREAGVYAGKILNGANPAELPVLQPSSVELAINVKTAKALGLTVPQALLLRADEVIR